ncbi:MAG TPA: hypothetical protein VGK83_05175 [Acidimicrobiia bacterium]
MRRLLVLAVAALSLLALAGCADEVRVEDIQDVSNEDLCKTIHVHTVIGITVNRVEEIDGCTYVDI